MKSTDFLTYIDPSSDTIISYDGKNFDNKLNKKSLIGSKVLYSDLVSHSFKIPQTMGDDELKTAVEIKMYEDAGLDLQKQYKIVYIKKELDFEDSLLIEAFALEISRAKDSLKSVLGSVKHIDFLALPFLSFEILYKDKVIEPKNDLFIFIGDDEAFLAIYKDGRYLSTKSLMCLSEMVEKLKVVGLDVTIGELKEHLQKKGLDATTYERDEALVFSELESVFSAIVAKVSDVVVYSRSIFGFEKIDRVFLSLENGRIRGIREFMHESSLSNAKVYDFNLFKKRSDGNFLDKILASYMYGKLENKDFRHNLTISKKEPAFYKKESSKILISLFFILLFCSAFIGFLVYENKKLELQKSELQKIYNIDKKNQSRYKSEIESINKKLKNTLEEKDRVSRRVKSIEDSVVKIESLEYDIMSHSNFIFGVNRLLQKHSLSTRKIDIEGIDSMTVELVAEFKKRDSITKFMEDLMSDGFVGITTDEIRLDSDVFISIVEIKR